MHTIPRCNELEMGIEDELKRKLMFICLLIYILYTVFTVTNASWCDDRIEANNLSRLERIQLYVHGHTKTKGGKIQWWFIH